MSIAHQRGSFLRCGGDRNCRMPPPLFGRHDADHPAVATAPKSVWRSFACGTKPDERVRICGSGRLRGWLSAAPSWARGSSSRDELMFGGVQLVLGRVEKGIVELVDLVWSARRRRPVRRGRMVRSASCGQRSRVRVIRRWRSECLVDSGGVGTASMVLGPMPGVSAPARVENGRQTVYACVEPRSDSPARWADGSAVGPGPPSQR